VVGCGQESAEQELKGSPSRLFTASLVRLEREGMQGFLLLPNQREKKRDKPWVWYAPTLLAEREPDWISPGARHAWIFNRLLAAGIAIAGVDVGESWGSPAGRAIYDRFYKLLVERNGFAKKPGLLPISRGGLMAYNWAADHADCVSCIGGVYPVCDLRHFARPERLEKPYAMTVEQVFAQLERHNPLERLQSLAQARVPILHLHGDSDQMVPVELHSAELARRYRALGGAIELVVVPGKGHEVCPEFWESTALVEFFRKHLVAD
jgi:dipeptidyl aminopeptidase/acylaminoacyl peptidase